MKYKTRMARQLRNKQTDAERLLWRYLRNRKILGYKFRRQHPIGRYIVDFVCLEKMVVIELDGGQHLEQTEQDMERTEYLSSIGYEVYRYWNNDVLVNTESVLAHISDVLPDTPHPSPLPSGERGLAG